MDDYGELMAEGTPGYATVNMALRAPRVAIRVPTGEHWRSMFALAMTAAGQLWGGAGFIYIPCSTQDGSVHPAILRVLRAYDPDYIVDMKLTISDMEVLQPGWLATRTRDVEAGTPKYEQLLETSGDMDVRIFGGDAIGAAVCSPYYDHFDEEDRAPRRVSFEGRDYGGPLAGRVAVTGDNQQPAFAILDGLDPDLCLALGMRAGFGSKPRLPLGTPDAESTDRDPLPKDYVRYALTVDRDQSYFGSELLGLSTVWQLSSIGLVPVAPVRRRSPAMAVVGSTPEDFALAVALDRMFGQTTWLPADWLDNPDLESAVQTAWWNFRQTGHRSGDAPVVTSVSIDAEELSGRLHARWPLPEVILESGDERTTLSEPAAASVAPSLLDLNSPRHLACTGDYDLMTTLPTRADGNGGFELLQDLPVHSPSSPALQSAVRPFWEVDVAVTEHPLPPSRDVSGQTFVVAQRRFAPSLPRSSRDGLSFNSMSMDFVPSGATLRQATASVRVRMPSLRTWVQAMVTRHEPEYESHPSDAGRRAMTCARLWGSRSVLASDLARLNGFFRAFDPPTRQRSVAYPDGDGFIVPGVGGLLTAAGAARALPDFDPGEVRSCLDRLLSRNVLRRGLVLRCSACERWDFYALADAAETNVCRRCGAYAHTTDARRELTVGEPAWYYDLHGAVRELLGKNGDVPLLAARTLAASGRRFADVPELDFLSPDRAPQEIDLICLVDDRLVIGEAKIQAELGSGRKRAGSITKLVRVANVLAADEIALCTTAPAPWKQEDIDLLSAELAAARWRTGVVPAIRVLADLRAGKPSNTLRRL